MKFMFDYKAYGFEMKGVSRDVHHTKAHCIGFGTNDGGFVLMITDETCDRQYVQLYFNDRPPEHSNIEHDVECELDILIALAKEGYLPAVAEVRKRLIDEVLTDL